MRAKRAGHFARLVGIAGSLLLLAGGARAEFQALDFPVAPAWYFVSLQVDPQLPDPLSVFPAGGGFEYDHIWSFDPIDGWRHFAPPTSDLPFEILDVVNDLDQIEPLRGYWIHVTSVPSSSFSLSVEGEPARLQQLVGADWFPIGPLLPPNATPANVDEVFADLGTSLSASIPEIWRYDRAGGAFIEVSDFAADCLGAPENCLAPASGYWVRTTGDVTLGREFRIRPSAVSVSAEDPLQAVEISYVGAPLPAAGVLRPNVAGTGIIFLPSVELTVDESIITAADPEADSSDGPDTVADLDGDGTPEACPDLCGGAVDCVDLCFQGPGRSHTVYVTLDPTVFAALEDFSGTVAGREFGTLEVDMGTLAGPPAGGGAAAAMALPSDIVASALVGVKPPILTGEYAGTLIYGDRGEGSVPIHMLLDDCTQAPGSAVRSCDGTRVTAIINPTLVGSSANGRDDDGDGAVDEDLEEGVLYRSRDGLGIPGDVRLYGSISSDNQILRLQGRADAIPDLAFASSVRCLAGECSDGSGVCSLASDCAGYMDAPRCVALECSDGSGSCQDDANCPRHGGIGNFFSGATRNFSFEAERTGATSFGGFFSDHYETPDLGSLSAEGSFLISRVSTAQCVARDVGATASVLLDVSCRADADCPLRCTNGDPELAGLTCLTDLDCTAYDENDVQKTAQCLPYPCQFVTLGGASSTALEHENVTLGLAVTLEPDGGGAPGEFDRATIEILGLDVIALATSADQSIALGEVPCGIYEIRVSAGNCAPVIESREICGAGPIADIPITCVGEAATATGVATKSIGGGFELLGGFVHTGPALVQLVDPVDAPCLPGPGVSCIARWEDGLGTPVPTILSGGIAPDEIEVLAVGGQHAFAGEDPFTSWTDYLRWPPESLRAGLLSQLAGLFESTP